MTDFTWWASLAPPGHFMCCLCFEARPIAEAHVDKDGTKWDVCTFCQAWEDGYRIARLIAQIRMVQLRWAGRG